MKFQERRIKIVNQIAQKQRQKMINGVLQIDDFQRFSADQNTKRKEDKKLLQNCQKMPYSCRPSFQRNSKKKFQICRRFPVIRGSIIALSQDRCPSQFNESSTKVPI